MHGRKVIPQNRIYVNSSTNNVYIGTLNMLKIVKLGNQTIIINGYTNLYRPLLFPQNF